MLAAASGAEGTAPAAPGTATGLPVSTMLRPDGSLDLTRDLSGSVDVAGYRMVAGPGGEPLGRRLEETLSELWRMVPR